MIMEKTRIDKWLWMVRIFKTRSMASDSCNAGKVKIGGVNCKPSREVKTNEEIQVRIGQLLKTVKVLDFPKNRLPAKLTPEYYEDLTPQEEYERIKMLHEHVEYREHGLGRPTKRDRRQLDYLKDFLSDTEDWE
ncbi:MAG: RNA-binding S4 domain-containing protein [Bacteroidales bacterium]|jgi:ribosome-associated heat shock protein Hsp15